MNYEQYFTRRNYIIAAVVAFLLVLGMMRCASRPRYVEVPPAPVVMAPVQPTYQPAPSVVYVQPRSHVVYVQPRQRVYIVPQRRQRVYYYQH